MPGISKIHRPVPSIECGFIEPAGYGTLEGHKTRCPILPSNKHKLPGMFSEIDGRKRKNSPYCTAETAAGISASVRRLISVGIVVVVGGCFWLKRFRGMHQNYM